MSDWQSTKAAAEELGCCGHTLKRKRDINGGFLEAGVHWVAGPTAKSPCQWNVPAIRQAFHQKGMEDRAAWVSNLPQQQNLDEA